MTLTNSRSLSTTALLAEIWRREKAGLPPHRRLVLLSNAALRRELEGRNIGIEPAAWFPPIDNRRDPFCATGLPALLLEHARRSCYLIGAGAVSPAADGRVQLHYLNYGSANSLCPGEPFWCQPSVIERHGETYGAYGYSGYLLTPRHVLTCWHGWDAFSRGTQVAIFDYCARSACDKPTTLPARSVRKIKLYPRAIAKAEDGGAACPGDWVVLELEQAFDVITSDSVPNIGKPVPGRAVYALGYPCGLPLKLADGATILSSSAEGFRADLDTFTGNSGSPVFDAVTHALLGIVVEAQQDEGDFEASPNLRCYVGNRVDSKIVGQRVIPAQCFAAALTQITGR